LDNPEEIQMPFALPHTQVSRQVALLLLLALVVVAALAAVTLAAPSASHHTLLSPTGGCGSCLFHQSGFGHGTQV